MKKFLRKLILIFLFPLLIPVIIFIVIDPFNLIGENRGKIKLNKNYNITWNRDFQSTELFIKNYRKYKYDSFIMGSSRSFYYNTKIWKKYIQGSCFHFNSSAESIYGIKKKIEFLSNENIDIKNLLLVLDYNVLENTENSKGHLFIKHPKISGESYIYFYLEMFNGFFPKAVYAYLDLFITSKPKAYMNKYGVTESLLKNNYKNNQLTNYLYDSIIKENSHNYYNFKRKVFYDRESIQTFYPIVIHKKQKQLLRKINRVLKTKKTIFKIVISPLYDQKKINQTDLIYLKMLFGNQNVYDFSGINDFTSNYMNYYETSHYRPNVSEEIMNIIYSNNN